MGNCLIGSDAVCPEHRQEQCHESDQVDMHWEHPDSERRRSGSSPLKIKQSPGTLGAADTILCQNGSNHGYTNPPLIPTEAVQSGVSAAEQPRARAAAAKNKLQTSIYMARRKDAGPTCHRDGKPMASAMENYHQAADADQEHSPATTSRSAGVSDEGQGSGSPNFSRGKIQGCDREESSSGHHGEQRSPPPRLKERAPSAATGSSRQRAQTHSSGRWSDAIFDGGNRHDERPAPIASPDVSHLDTIREGRVETETTPLPGKDAARSAMETNGTLAMSRDRGWPGVAQVTPAAASLVEPTPRPRSMAPAATKAHASNSPS